MDEFRPLIPVIQAVKNPGMKERHWNEFMEKAGKFSLPHKSNQYPDCA